MAKHLILDVYGTLRNRYNIEGLIADLNLKCTKDSLEEELNKNYWCREYDLCRSEEESVKELSRILGTGVTNTEVIDAYINNRGKVDKELLHLIIEMTNRNLKVGTLSDCGILMAADNIEFSNAYRLSFCFNSCISGFGKWEERCYQIVRSLLGCKPEEIYFIDDTQKYIELAKRNGWNAYLWSKETRNGILEEIEYKFKLK